MDLWLMKSQIFAVNYEMTRLKNNSTESFESLVFILVFIGELPDKPPTFIYVYHFSCSNIEGY